MMMSLHSDLISERPNHLASIFTRLRLSLGARQKIYSHQNRLKCGLTPKHKHASKVDSGSLHICTAHALIRPPSPSYCHPSLLHSLLSSPSPLTLITSFPNCPPRSITANRSSIPAILSIPSTTRLMTGRMPCSCTNFSISFSSRREPMVEVRSSRLRRTAAMGTGRLGLVVMP